MENVRRISRKIDEVVNFFRISRNIEQGIPSKVIVPCWRFSVRVYCDEFQVALPDPPIGNITVWIFKRRRIAGIDLAKHGSPGTQRSLATSAGHEIDAGQCNVICRYPSGGK